MASNNPYAKVHEADQERLIAAHRTRRRVVAGISAVILLCILVAIVVGVSLGNDKKPRQQDQPVSSDIKAICDVTLYPDSCYSSLAPLVKSGHFRPQDIFRLSVQVAVNELLNVSKEFNADGGLKNLNVTDENTLAALESCQELLFLAVYHLNTSLAVDGLTLLEAFDDLRTWISAAGTCQETCIDGLGNSTLSSIVLQKLKNSTEFTSNSLAIITSIESSIVSLGSIGNRRLMGINDMPEWLSRQDRKLIEATNSSIVADAVVAQDGSGEYKTISAALNDAPNNGKQRYVIYIKKGVYVENVRIDIAKRNVMMIGDGMNATVVSGSLNFVDGTPTFSTATFAVFGQGFIARDMAFLNTAGAPKQQAVALFSSADQSIFFRCRIDAFQDTLYTHSNRQFYRECDIYGTVDFIFGNSAVVFQNCNILARKPMSGQQNTITAQGKIDPNQNTGISIQNCTVSPAEDLTGVSSYLGRPWKNYSTTVYMQTVISGFVDPKGWLPWQGAAAAPDTIFYSEYQNSGPGAVTYGRVNWTGLKLNMTSKQAGKYTVSSFIKGDKWIPATNITYKSGL
ncbi:UNVERIFIED_CONTAM: putative pectinesterase/pectinesterase inhibitor 46 [Sesamum angustifolium]|uniref:Pectinesterase n=1 Tax=Sesamum angustifolium TaxID=2727405 RepID=A0AAW2LU61_9LAMI